MNLPAWVVAIGWIGNACFFSRFLVQWLQSERAGRSVAPRSFWWLSLVGTALLFAYTFRRGELVLLAGFTVNAFLYARNLRLAYAEDASEDRPRVGWTMLVTAGSLALVGLLIAGLWHFEPGATVGAAWLAVGIAGQTLWSSRFVLQWIASERRGASHFPRAFWWLSLAGNSLLLAYAIHLGDPVWIAGLALGPIVQVRNLMLGRKDGVSDRGARPPCDARAELGRARPSH